MTEKNIKLKDVEYVSKLARVSLTPDEKKNFQEQLENILEYFSILKKAKTENVPPAAHPWKVENVWREDKSTVFPDKEGLFKNAPEMEETLYKVKKVIE